VKIKRPKLAKATRRWDPAALREALADGKVHASLALVVLEDGSHFEIDEYGVLVHLELQPSGIACTARLGGMGLYAIPPVGAEVAVLVPDGEVEMGPVVVARTDQAPDGLDGSTFVIQVPAGGELVVHDGAADDAVKLVTWADFENHTHTTAGTGSPVGPTKLTPPGPFVDGDGTQALRSK
jgi:hypothetical protein